MSVSRRVSDTLRSIKMQCDNISCQKRGSRSYQYSLHPPIAYRERRVASENIRKDDQVQDIMVEETYVILRTLRGRISSIQAWN